MVHVFSVSISIKFSIKRWPTIPLPMTTTFFFSAYSCDEDFDEEVAGVDEMNGEKACTSMEMLERKRETHAAELFMMVMLWTVKNYEHCYSSSFSNPSILTARSIILVCLCHLAAVFQPAGWL